MQTGGIRPSAKAILALVGLILATPFFASGNPCDQDPEDILIGTPLYDSEFRNSLFRLCSDLWVPSRLLTFGNEEIGHSSVISQARAIDTSCLAMASVELKTGMCLEYRFLVSAEKRTFLILGTGPNESFDEDLMTIWIVLNEGISSGKGVSISDRELSDDEILFGYLLPAGAALESGQIYPLIFRYGGGCVSELSDAGIFDVMAEIVTDEADDIARIAIREGQPSDLRSACEVWVHNFLKRLEQQESQFPFLSSLAIANVSADFQIGVNELDCPEAIIKVQYEFGRADRNGLFQPMGRREVLVGFYPTVQESGSGESKWFIIRQRRNI